MMQLLPLEGLGSASDARAPAGGGRSAELSDALVEFEAQLMGFLLRGMRRAFLEESEGVAGHYADFADSALARALARQGIEAGRALSGDLMQRLTRSDAQASASVAEAAPVLQAAAAVAATWGRLAPGGATAVAVAGPGTAEVDSRSHVPLESSLDAAPPRTVVQLESSVDAVLRPPEPSLPRAAGAAPEVTSRIGPRRDPFTGKQRFHAGLDLRAARGTPVQSAAAGVVVRTAHSGGLGRHVIVEHAGGYRSLYAHLESIDVREGQRLGVAERLGRVGSSGRATGPHLHFELRHQGRPVDPAAVVGDAENWVWPVRTVDVTG